MKNTVILKNRYLWSAILLISMLLGGCISNDLPYPKIIQNICEIEADGELKPAYIDSVSQEAVVYLKETVDIERVRFFRFNITEGGTATPNLLDSVWNMTNPISVKLSLYQEYTWTVRAVQDIERYFEVDGEVGTSSIDPVAHRIIVHVPQGTDLKDLRLVRCKLGPKCLTTVTPELNPGKLDLSFPLQVEVECFGRTTIWTIYAEITESVVTTSRVDAWSKVVWAYGVGPADVMNGFEYRKAGTDEWTPVPDESIIQTQGDFSCCIPHLDTLTEYEVRSVSGENKGNIIKVTTESTELIPDGDFDQWYKTPKGMWCPWNENGEKFWDTGNTGTMTLGTNNTEPSDHLPPGITTGNSVEMTTRFVGIGILGKLGSGSIFTGSFKKVDGTNGILDFGRVWKLRPTKLKGYYQYRSIPIDYTSAELGAISGKPDTCQIYVALTDWTAPYEIRTNPKNRNLFDKNAGYIIAYGELVSGEVMDGYKPFEIELKYRDTSRVPSYLQITCTASKYGDYFTGGNGSKLWVDQFSFDWDY